MHMLLALLLLSAGAFVLVMGIRGSYWQAFGVANPFTKNAGDTFTTAGSPSNVK